MKKLNFICLIISFMILITQFVACNKNKEELEKNVKSKQGMDKKEDENFNIEDYPPFLKLNVQEKSYDELIVNGMVDLDFDGKEEEIYFKSDYEDEEKDWEIVKGEFTINKEKIDLEQLCKPYFQDSTDFETMFSSIDVIDLDPMDNKRELLVYKKVSSGVPVYIAEVFHYENGKLKSIGEIHTNYAKTLDEISEEQEYSQSPIFNQKNHTVSFLNDNHAICNFWHNDIWQLENEEIKRITNEELEMFLINEKGQKEDIVLKTIGSFNLYEDNQWNKKIYEVQPNDEIKFISCIPGKWVKVSTSDGKTGYVKYILEEDEDGNIMYVFDDSEGKMPMDVFQNLPLWN